MKLGQLIDIGMSNVSKKNFAYFGKLGPKPRLSLIQQSKIIINHKVLLVNLCFFSVPKMYSEMIENIKHHLIKTKISSRSSQ